MIDRFDNYTYVNTLATELKLKESDIATFLKKYQMYAQNVFCIPITVHATPTPYSPLRVNYVTGRVYVPNKKKLVTHIRKLILQELGTDKFKNEYFPRFQETILKSSLYLPTPKSFTRECKYVAELKLLRPVVTPDLDNVLKIINDAVKDFLIYDDAQIVSNVTEKFYSTTPRMEIEIIYNASVVSPIHQKTIGARKHRWTELLQSENPPAIVSLLHKYINT